MKILSTPDGPLSSGLAAREARGSGLGARGSGLGAREARGSGLARLGARDSGLARLSVIHDNVTNSYQKRRFVHYNVESSIKSIKLA